MANRPMILDFEEETKSNEKIDENKEYRDKKEKALITTALESTISANSKVAVMEAERSYATEKRKHMLTKCKKDRKVSINCPKILAQYFGKVYTFAYNGLHVTVYFDGKNHEYPEFIANKITEKINKVSDSNTYKENIENLTH